ncbi:hypothetical protein EVAR_58573_1 [Eumeta japonica]|uniref:Uncharacterized protein n=1 Tax=Eumeta variegata TaxID=151549 RepID=A0A4C1Z5R5_EUMVA|nr:hypothetical protein EVAR_58573_1 [Eumeta japonica]
MPGCQPRRAPELLRAKGCSHTRRCDCDTSATRLEIVVFKMGMSKFINSTRQLKKFHDIKRSTQISTRTKTKTENEAGIRNEGEIGIEIKDEVHCGDTASQALYHQGRGPGRRRKKRSNPFGPWERPIGVGFIWLRAHDQI